MIVEENNERYNKIEPKTVSVYFSGYCNLKCTYCYNPKIPGKMNKSNLEIKKWITSGKLLNDLKDITNYKLENISFWGGESTYNFTDIIPELDKYYLTFPSLKSFSFSTNISNKIVTDNVISFIDCIYNLNKRYEKTVNVEIQFSMDGSDEYNNKARIGSKSSEIVNNITRILNHINDNIQDDRFLFLSGKGTYDVCTLKKLYEGDNLITLWKWYDKLYLKWKDIYKRYPLMDTICYAYPSHDTKDDGYFFSLFIKKYYKLANEVQLQTFKPIEQIYTYIKGLMDANNKTINRNFKGELTGNMSCSVGVDNFAIDHKGNFHICQGTMFLEDVSNENNNFYKEEINKLKQNNDDLEKYRKYIKDTWVFKYNNKLKLSRTLHNLETYKNNILFREKTLDVLVRHLAMSNMIDKKYLKTEEARILIFVFLGCFQCPVNSLLEYGNLWTPAEGMLKRLGNGAVDILLEQLKKDGVMYGI